MVVLKETDMSLNPNSAADLLCDLEQCRPLFIKNQLESLIYFSIYTRQKRKETEF